MNCKHSIKAVLIGDSYVGKTSLCKAITNGDFVNIYSRTIGIDYKVKNIVINNRELSICLWDLCGDERFQFMFDSFVDTNKILFFMYSADSLDSFIHMKKLFEYYLSNNYLKDKKIIVIATKIDSDNCYLDYEKHGIEFSKLYNYLFIKTSSKTKYGIQELIDMLINTIIINNKNTETIYKKNCCLM